LRLGIEADIVSNVASTSIIYMRELHKKWRYWPTWLPGKKIRVGDFGPLDGVVFQPLGNLKKDFQIPLRTELSGEWPALTHHSARAVSFKLDPSAKALVGRGKAKLVFTRSDAVVFVADEVHERSMVGKGAVLGALQERRDFHPNHVIVSDVLTAETLTVLISGSRGEEVVVDVAVPVGTPVGPALLRSVAGITSSSVSGLEIVGKKRPTPLFKLMYPPQGWGRRGIRDFRDLGLRLGGRVVPDRVGYLHAESEFEFQLGASAPISVQPRATEVVIGTDDGQGASIEIERWGPLDVYPLLAFEHAREGGGGWSEEMSPLVADVLSTAGDPNEIKVALQPELVLVESPSGERVIGVPAGPVAVEVTRESIPVLPEKPAAVVEYVDFEMALRATSAESPTPQ
jgi:hypothetical protein